MSVHQYVERTRNQIADERLIADQIIRFLYNQSRDEPGFLQRALATGVITDALAYWQFDRRVAAGSEVIANTAHRMMVRESELLVPYSRMQTLRELFERQIRYWDTRPLPEQTRCIVSPADGKLLPFAAFSREALPIKSRFLKIDALLAGVNPWASSRPSAQHALAGVVVRLTPDVYHYTHAPVAGIVRKRVTLEGAFHSCNPTALVRFEGSYALNRRVVTVYDTNVHGGSGVGHVVQVDVVAMMIGDIESRFSTHRYDHPRELQAGDFVPRGAPVSLFRPGSSTSIVLWDGKRCSVAEELLANAKRADVKSRFSEWLGQPWAETSVAVRQAISETIFEDK